MDPEEERKENFQRGHPKIIGDDALVKWQNRKTTTTKTKWDPSLADHHREM